MSIRFRCPNCQTIRSFNPRLLGREVRCPECDSMIMLPSEEQLRAAQEARDKAKRLEERQREEVARASVAIPPKLTDKPAEEDEDDEESFVDRRQMPHDHIDMTAMVDITFLLLIFFMSTANFTLVKAFQVPVKKNDQASTNAIPEPQEVSDSVTVQINEFNAYTVLMGDGTERDAPSKQDLIIALEEARSLSSNIEPPEKLIVEAHRDCTHAAVVAAIDAGRDKQFSSFQVTVVESFD